MTDQFHPGKCLPDCMMPDSGECCPGYVALYDAYWHLIRGAPAQRAPSREVMAETIHNARWPADRQMAVTPFADEDRNGREYCFRIADAVLAALTSTECGEGK